jgi:hypothetical protein
MITVYKTHKIAAHQRISGPEFLIKPR